MNRTFLLETVEVPKDLRSRLAAIPKPKSMRARSKARKKVQLVLQTLIKNRKE